MKLNINIKTAICVALAILVTVVLWNGYNSLQAELQAEKDKNTEMYKQKIYSIDSVIHNSQQKVAVYALRYDSIEAVNCVLEKKRKYDKVRYIYKIKEIKVFNDSTRNRYIDSLSSYIAR